jgi:hypothetical protein
MDDFMSKPVNLNDLEKMLVKWMRLRGGASHGEA